MKLHLLLILSPVLGVVARTPPLRAHKFNPRAEALSEVQDSFSNAQKDKLKTVPLTGDTVIKAEAFTPQPSKASSFFGRHAVEVRQAAPTTRTTGLPTGWRYLECYSESNDAHALTNFVDDGITFSSDGYDNGDKTATGVSAVTCINYCSNLGYPLAGMTYYYQCRCAYRVNPLSTLQTGKCTEKCYALETETCGGVGYEQIYINDNGALYPPKVPSTLPNNYAYVDCYATGTGTSQVMVNAISRTSASNTGAECVGYCNTATTGGYKYAGTMNNQCYCSQLLMTSPTSARCVQQCPGGKAEACGGSSKVSVYQRAAVLVSGISVCCVCVLCWLLDDLLCVSFLDLMGLGFGRGLKSLSKVLTQAYVCLWKENFFLFDQLTDLSMNTLTSWSTNHHMYINIESNQTLELSTGCALCDEVQERFSCYVESSREGYHCDGLQHDSIPKSQK
jgi:hypothetical protein